MKNNHYKNKNILITGISGFVGSHLRKSLEDKGANVYGIARNAKEKVILNANIVSLNEIEKFVKKKKIDICFHLAGNSLVEKGQDNPYAAFETNIMGTLNILELGRKYKFKKIIIASTAHVYGKNAVPYIEESPPIPTRPYETSKACIDLMALSYAKTYRLPVVIPRFVNIYGPGDLNYSRIVPKTIISLLVGKSPTIWGGEIVRDYIYIDDVINAYLKLGELSDQINKKHTIFNFGANNLISVRELMQKLVEISKKNVKLIAEKDMRADEIKIQYVNWEKASSLLQWKPIVKLEDGLFRTYRWYEKFLKR